ncbi:polysaccharide pyruvyl transferase family protein [Desulfomicrobium baculatum]|uniref:Polysaccharide pyruvyl transferase domain-containing protein n=1 Tax=Desulfomicrobium baculatum (strain DSM 4028 / VKM B-1378 / X) TaxID=525897 RepID=C7LS78_DESBD|nr:polysaccharide pyruvyl transferase family protein [Desulfomicrobium baculatum]ACU90626.1 conserved hypothetical protein [Desulfomicrobium baculatum DSM 4028]
MIKIGILTIVKVNNYGAELQAFALQYKLNNLGYNAELIDYLFYKNKYYKFSNKSLPIFKISLKNKLKEKLLPLLEIVRSYKYRKNKKIREQKFDKFHIKFSKFSSLTYFSYDDLYSENFDYDCFVVGSDQVWNPYNYVSIEPYFLTFAPLDKPKISYASSFGVSSIPTNYHSEYRKLLNVLDAISVREARGVELIKEMSGRNSVHVVDPTLLLGVEDWRTVAELPSYEHPYLLLYVLTESSYITKLAKLIAKNLNFSIIRICKNASSEDTDSSIVNIIDAGPSEFVGYFMKASFVLTNSFHGTTFSTLFEKPFFTILPKNKPNNSRQQGFLFSIGLEDRLIEEGSSFPHPECYALDFTEPSVRLQELRVISEEYLFHVLGSPE